MRKAIRCFCGCLCAVCTLILGEICYWQNYLPDEYLVQTGESLTLNESLTTEAVTLPSNGIVRAVSEQTDRQYRTEVRWHGLFPVKTVSVNTVDTPVVVLGGIPFGIKLYTDGVLIVSLSEVDTAAGSISPAKRAGLKIGDVIVSINGHPVYTNEEVAELIRNSDGTPLTMSIRRDNILSAITFRPARSVNEGRYKAGLWVRDSSAGIGTLTFYDPKSNLLAGLGHAICDVDTGKILPILSGEMVPSRIYGVTRSQAGTPGELRGGFEAGKYGDILTNSETGIYADCDSRGMVGKTVGILLKQEIHEGDAQLYTTIQGDKPDWYTVRIRQIRYRDSSATRNMIVEVTDERLLNNTGGIVQGMSGSPIVQDGKLAGAVTHVFVNDPTKGYAIFAENMLIMAQSTADKKQSAAS